ncbi:MAG: hypothetical protein R3174_13325 [Gammaproteobacteria bacterium]|nr:hypothetical protein [Gammaproteobacteria bacterium]
MRALILRESSLAGTLLAAMLALSVVHGLSPAVPEWIAGAAAWAAAVLLWKRLSVGQKRQCSLLMFVGLAGIVCGAWGGVDIRFSRLLDENQKILALIAGVSFVHMAVSGGRSAERSAPRGPSAFLRTLLSLNLLAAAINITALVLVADRVSRLRPLKGIEIAAFSRVFSLAVLYSPFIGGMALALNLAPEASFSRIVMVGAGLAVAGIAFTYIGARYRNPESLAAFQGYPLRLDVLWLPAVLAGAVFAVHAWWPDVSVLTIIAILGPLISWLAVALGSGPARAGARLIDHVTTRLPAMSGELWLFLSAGILSVGLSSAVEVIGLDIPETRYYGSGASAVLLAVIGLAAAGIHPIISLSALVPLLGPLSLTQEGIVILYVAGWSIGCAICPFSGTNLVLQAGHGVSPWRFPLWNAGYAVFMWALASVALYFEAGLG